MSATEPGSRVTAGATVASWNGGIGDGGGQPVRGEHADHRADRPDQQRGDQQADDGGRPQSPVEQGLPQGESLGRSVARPTPAAVPPGRVGRAARRRRDPARGRRPARLGSAVAAAGRAAEARRPPARASEGIGQVLAVPAVRRAAPDRLARRGPKEPSTPPWPAVGAGLPRVDRRAPQRLRIESRPAVLPGDRHRRCRAGSDHRARWPVTAGAAEPVEPRRSRRPDHSTWRSAGLAGPGPDRSVWQ